METVRLDSDAADGAEPPKRHFFVVCVSAARRNLFALGMYDRSSFSKNIFTTCDSCLFV